LPLRQQILFLHPGYDSLNALLILPCVDPVTSNTVIVDYGVHHNTALLACQIIAGNAFKGTYLALDEAGKKRVQVPREGTLPDPEYYFIVPGEDPHPIVPSFQDWKFPHGSIPESWPSVIPSQNWNKDCSLTNSRYSVETAHLIPKSERDWYIRNEMHRYDGAYDDIDDAGNLIPLRENLHTTFDTRRSFVIVPKEVAIRSETSVDSGREYVVHHFSMDDEEVWRLHHTVIIETLHHRARPYIFARFAWAVFSKLKFFVIAGLRRRTIRLVKDTGSGSIAYRTDWTSRDDL
ncbi:hypothetical protein B0T26DRAFT_653187, partial [Lasiosphaeria miniovina]